MLLKVYISKNTTQDTNTLETSELAGLFKRPNLCIRNFFSQYLNCLDLWRLNN